MEKNPLTKFVHGLPNMSHEDPLGITKNKWEKPVDLLVHCIKL